MLDRSALQVKRASAGLGLFATQLIPKGTKVIEYVGERISNAEADRRGGRYLFEVNSRWTIDGKARDNLARYINHSCDPNCEAREVRGRVFIYTIAPIAVGEELTYDYGEEYIKDIIAPEGCRCEVCQPQS